jgi:exonuclease SbcD
MRLVHLSDLHLGFRQYQRLTPGGLNQREADVAAAVRQAIDTTIALRPDLVLIAGDVFHTVRPSNPAILHGFQQLSRLVRELPDASFVMVAGNHDVPRSTETGCILRLFTPLGIEVVDAEARRVHFPEKRLSVLALPDTLGPRPALTPDPNAEYNVLLLHGEVAGILPPALLDAERARIEITPEELGAERWNYVALGHYHVYRQVAPNAYYSGSIEYTSSNTWGEMLEERQSRIPGKGLIEHDLATGAHRFHPIAASRAFADLGSVSATGMTAADLDAAVRDAVGAVAGGIEGKVVRLVVRDAPRHIVREMNHAALRDYKRRALHFHLDTRRPEVHHVRAYGAPGRRPTLADVVRAKLETRVLDGDVDRDALVALGLSYLREAEARELMPAAEAEPA